MKKAIIIGPPLCGKTTLVKLLRESYPNLVVKELDEMLIELNGNVWPADELYRNGVLVPKIIKGILSEDSDFLFFTTYISPEDIHKAKKNGFLIIQLTCPREVLVSRNIKNNKISYHEMDRNLGYQVELMNNKLVDIALDSSNSPKEIISGLATYINLLYKLDRLSV
jgi:dephospho-CoA kinase